MRNTIRLAAALLAVFAASAIITPELRAEEGIKARMEARLSEITTLKSKGIIGEDNKGYLSFVGSSKEGQSVVDAENADRKLIYTKIAKDQGTSPDAVAKLRARKNAERAAKGEYIQDDSGKWTRK